MHTDSLFDEEDDLFGAAPEARAKRRRVELRPCDLEALQPEDHQARLVREFVERQGLRAQIYAVSARAEVIAPVPKPRQRKQDDDDGSNPSAALSEFDPDPAIAARSLPGGRG